VPHYVVWSFSCYSLFLNFRTLFSNIGVKWAVCGPRGTNPADLCVCVCVCVCVPLKAGKRHLFLPSPMQACPRHDPWKRLWTAKSCKGETQIPDAIIGTNQLREITPTENPRSSKTTGVEHRASNLVFKKLTR